jgi:hypothetical protein
VTRHSIVRSPWRRGKVIATPKGAVDVTMTGDESPGDAFEVILGVVDTHLDLPVVAVALERLGRRLGELAVPATAKGYEKLIRWAKRLGAPLRAPG